MTQITEHEEETMRKMSRRAEHAAYATLDRIAETMTFIRAYYEAHKIAAALAPLERQRDGILATLRAGREETRP